MCKCVNSCACACACVVRGTKRANEEREEKNKREENPENRPELPSLYCGELVVLLSDVGSRLLFFALSPNTGDIRCFAFHRHSLRLPLACANRSVRSLNRSINRTLVTLLLYCQHYVLTIAQSLGGYDSRPCRYSLELVGFARCCCWRCFCCFEQVEARRNGGRWWCGRWSDGLVSSTSSLG